MANNPQTLNVNVAGVDVGTFGVRETFPPNSPFSSFFQNPGEQSTSSLYRGNTLNSSLAYASQNLSHICDVRYQFNISTNLIGIINPATALTTAIQNAKLGAANKLAGYLRDAVQYFRDAIEIILKVLSADLTGQFSLSFAISQSIIDDLNEYIRYAADKLEQVLTWVFLAQEIAQLINWIESLPAKLQQLVQSCVVNFNNSINQIAQSVNTLPNQLLQQTVGQVQTLATQLTTTVNSNVQSLQTSLSSNNNSLPPGLALALSDPTHPNASSGVQSILSSQTSASTVASQSQGTKQSTQQKP